MNLRIIGVKFHLIYLAARIMTRIKIALILIGAFLMAGCADKHDVRALNNANSRMKKDIQQLQAQVAALEDVCLQLNSQIQALQNRRISAGAGGTEESSDQSPQFQPLPDETGVKAETAVTTLTATSPDKITRFTFKSHVIGLEPERVTALFGKPDQVTGSAGNQSWVYPVIRLATEDGREEGYSALIVFEKGCVSRGVLTEKLERNAALAAQEAAPANPQAAATNQ